MFSSPTRPQKSSPLSRFRTSALAVRHAVERQSRYPHLCPETAFPSFDRGLLLDRDRVPVSAPKQKHAARLDHSWETTAKTQQRKKKERPDPAGYRDTQSP